MTTRIVADLFSLNRPRFLVCILVGCSIVLASLPKSWTEPVRATIQGPVVRVAAMLQSGIDAVFLPPIPDQVDPEIKQALEQRELILKNRIQELRQQIQVLENFKHLPLAESGRAASAEIILTRKARLTMAPASLWGEGFLLNRGSRDGVKINDVVVVEIPGLTNLITHFEDLAGYWLLGKVDSVGPLSCKVKTLNQPGFRTSVKILDDQTSKDISRGMARGNDMEKLSVQYIAIDHPVDSGDLVVTDGRDGIFPRGLVVGQVTAVSDKTVHGYKDVEVTPSISPDYRQWVLIVRRRPVKPPE